MQTILLMEEEPMEDVLCKCSECGTIYKPGERHACAPRDPLLQERERTHGSYTVTARAAQGIKEEMHGEDGWASLSDRQKESLEMIATKIGRIISGNPNEKDHWNDIAGYAKLGAEACND